MSSDRTGPPGDKGAVSAPPIHLTRVDLGQNMARFYDISLQPTLFDEVALMRRWGRIGTRGQALMQTFDGGAAAQAAQARLEQSKRRRGYR